MTEQPVSEATPARVHFHRFSSYHYTMGKDGMPELATVPEAELRDLIEAANLAEAASPRECQHPADSLEAFELIPDACVCGECGAVLKDYGPREAQALGIARGWQKLTADLLAAEIYNSLRPVFRAIDDMRSAISQYGSARDAMNWADDIDSHSPQAKALGRVR